MNILHKKIIIPAVFVTLIAVLFVIFNGHPGRKSPYYGARQVNGASLK